MTVDLYLNSVAIPDVLCDSLFTTLELGTLKPWLVRSVKESDRKVADCGSHVQLVVTRGDNKVEKDTVTLDEEKGQNHVRGRRT